MGESVHKADLTRVPKHGRRQLCYPIGEPPIDSTAVTDAIVWLNDSEAADRRIGGKGGSLARLSRLGFPVPPGFVVAAEAYDDFAAAHDLPSLTAPLSGLEARTPMASIRAALEPVAARLGAASLDGDTHGAIADAVAELEARTGAGASFAVRSSSLNEDSAGSSFAGLYESYLNLRGEDAILAALLDCYRCLWQERAVQYRTFRGIDHAGEAMAVVVMQVVRARSSGVAFTKNPMTGATDEVLINASWGLGEAVVSGYVTPDSFIVGPGGEVRERAISEKHEQVRLMEGGTERAPVPPDLVSRPSISDAEVEEVVDTAHAVQGEYGRPVDIEFAYDDSGTMFLLQARPITT